MEPIVNNPKHFIGTGSLHYLHSEPGNINGNNVIFKQGDIEINIHTTGLCFCESSGL